MSEITDKDLASKDELFPPTENEKAAIEHFLAYMESVGQKTLSKYKRIPHNQRDKSTVGMIEYWTKVVSGISWIRSINHKRKAVEHGQTE